MTNDKTQEAGREQQNSDQNGKTNKQNRIILFVNGRFTATLPKSIIVALFANL